MGHGSYGFRRIGTLRPMHPARRPFIGGNWKMNTTRAAAVELARSIAAGISAAFEAAEAPPLAVDPRHGSVATMNRPGSGTARLRCEVVVFPPFPYLLPVSEALDGDAIGVGGQDVSPHDAGAFTGEVSATMLRDAGARWVIIGHSERRHGLRESDRLCGDKFTRAIEGGLSVVFCVGETWDERRNGATHEVNRRQLEAGFERIKSADLTRVVVAYEPVWAIGTGKTASAQDAQEAHRSIREFLGGLYDSRSVEALRILYGGSVNGSNAAALFSEPDIDGGLIGGASLKPAEFLSIIAATDALGRRAGS